MHSTEVPYSAGVQARVERYERVRKRLGLARIEVEYLKECVRIRWPTLPPPVPAGAWTRSFAQRTLRWLTALERSWGESLNGTLDVSAVRFDPRRRQFAIGEALFSPPVDPDLLPHLADALGAPPLPSESFTEYALRIRLQGIEMDEATRARTLIAAAHRALDAGHPGRAMQAALAAWELRQGDEDAGALCIRAAVEERTLAQAPAVLAVANLLEARESNSANTLYLLARFRWTAGEYALAGKLATAATERDPRHAGAWRLRGGSARAAGNNRQFVDSFASAARLGDPKALATLAKYADSDQWGPIVEDWQGDFDTLVLGLRIRWLTAEHRFQRALRDALQRPHLMRDLSADALEALEKAATRVRGGTMGLREALRPLVSSTSSRPVLQCYARLCLLDLQPTEVLRISQVRPGVLSPPLVLKAHMAAEDWNGVLRLTQGKPSFAGARLVALQRLSALRGRHATSAEVRSCLESMRQQNQIGQIRELLAQLEATLADHTFTMLLRDELLRMEARP